MSDIMKKLNLVNMFPCDIPEGYTYQHLTNFSSNHLDLYTDVVSNFDFKSAFKDNISMRIIDNATTCDGILIDNYYALYVIYPLKVYEMSDEEIQLRNVVEQLKNSIKRSQSLKDISEISFGNLPCPDMGTFWRYFEMIRDTKYPHLKLRV